MKLKILNLDRRQEIILIASWKYFSGGVKKNKNKNKKKIKNKNYRITWYLFAGFWTIILNSVHSIRFVKCVSGKVWFVKTSPRLVKYESRDVKLNLVNVQIYFQSAPAGKEREKLSFNILRTKSTF